MSNFVADLEAKWAELESRHPVTPNDVAQTLWGRTSPADVKMAKQLLRMRGWREHELGMVWYVVPILLWYDNGTGYYDCAGEYPNLKEAKEAARKGWRTRCLAVHIGGIWNVDPTHPRVIWDSYKDEWLIFF